jgi:hypothetical protein
VAVVELIEVWSYWECPILSMPFNALMHMMACLEPPDLCLVAQTCLVSTPPLELHSHWP